MSDTITQLAETWERRLAEKRGATRDALECGQMLQLRTCLDELRAEMAKLHDTITQLARPPFAKAERGHVRDATGSLVITCDDEILCMLFSEREVEKDGHFLCPKCGRLGQRMVEATPAQCGL